MTTAEFGARVGGILGRQWPRQVVSAAETGKRALTAVEMVACAQALDVSIAFLFTPPAGVSEIMMPSGVLMPVSDLTRGRSDLDTAREAARRDYERAIRAAESLTDNLAALLQSVAALSLAVEESRSALPRAS